MPAESMSVSDSAPVRDEQRHALVLRVWETINAERELGGVLSTVAEMLASIVPFDGVGLVAFEAERPRPYAFHIVGSPHESRSAEEVWRAFLVHPQPVRPSIGYEGSDLWQEPQAGRPYACTDLTAKDAWLPHEFKLAAVGVRAYAACPLHVRGKRIGVATFCRAAPAAFTPEHLTVLSDVSRALAVATANALANEEIRKLREQLE